MLETQIKEPAHSKIRGLLFDVIKELENEGCDYKYIQVLNLHANNLCNFCEVLEDCLRVTTKENKTLKAELRQINAQLDLLVQNKLS